MRNFFLALLLALPAMPGIAELGHHLQPALGSPASDASKPVVMPDGSGLPSGEGNVQQGRTVYEAHCASCHGTDGRQAGNELAGGHGTLTSPRPLRTVGSYWPYATTLFDYIRRAMPYGDEKTLSDSEIYALVAYILHLNEIVTDDATLNRESLPNVVMPNRNGFYPAPDFGTE